jgi:hypothetical protein
MPLCLKFQRKDGLTPTVTAETDGASLTEFLTLNTGESPSVAVESTLSQILEVNAPGKYYLSAKACEGILRRAERRGKELPPMLKEALEQQIERERNQTPLSKEEKIKITKAAFEIGKMAEEGMIGDYPSPVE